MELPATEVLLRTDFYVTGGTLRPDAPSYIERKADKELCEGLLQGEFSYVLTSRQMGKSSLMVRTVRRLRHEGVKVAVLDLTAIGQNLSIEQWYDGLASRLGQQLGLEDEIEEFWTSHADAGPLQRWTSALEKVVLERIPGRVVIFIDEIDMVRSLPFSTDEFFAGIRECYNRRAHQPAYNRLAFGLLGVATPTDLIRDTRMTPFNIGRRIELNDFAPEEAAPLAAGLAADPVTATELLQRVLYWTGGHPYLTQRLCRALSESIVASHQANAASTPRIPPMLPTTSDVDRVAEKLFLSRQARDRDDNLIFVRERLLRNELDVPGLLLLYRRIHIGELVQDDETNPLISILHLAGIVRGVNGYLHTRNRIYRHVFDLTWIQTNMPAAEVRRQRKAGRRGMLVGFTAAALLLAGYIFLVPVWKQYRELSLARKTLEELPDTYLSAKSYKDNFETQIEIAVAGVSTPVMGSGSLLYEAPDKLSLSLRSGFNSPEREVRLLSNGEKSMLYAPELRQIQVLSLQPKPSCFELPAPVVRQLGPVTALPLFRLLLDRGAAGEFLKEAHDLQGKGAAFVEGQPVRILQWNHDADRFLRSLGMTNRATREGRIPITAWVNSSNNLVVRMDADLSAWGPYLVSIPGQAPLTRLFVAETHKQVQASSNTEPSVSLLRWEIHSEVRPVDELELRQAQLLRLESVQEFARLIPPRLAFTPENLIDLSNYYNAALAETWHPGTENNTLVMLPTGVLELGGTAFDVRGIVQLAGKRLPDLPLRYGQRAMGIKVRQQCRQLHFLHATGWSTRDGVRVGSYVVHYSNGRREEIPLIYGEDFRDWNGDGDKRQDTTRGKIVWRAKNDANFSVRLFKLTWLNPAPEVQIESLDFISAMADPAPFLVALTVEQ